MWGWILAFQAPPSGAGISRAPRGRAALPILHPDPSLRSQRIWRIGPHRPFQFGEAARQYHAKRHPAAVIARPAGDHRDDPAAPILVAEDPRARRAEGDIAVQQPHPLLSVEKLADRLVRQQIRARPPLGDNTDSTPRHHPGKAHERVENMGRDRRRKPPEGQSMANVLHRGAARRERSRPPGHRRFACGDHAHNALPSGRDRAQ